ncbi:MAG: outer membrane beta-barrel protein, partial [Saprospiraceae bacterium]|nr:outer membrane beta-barrel protein [Saprospiraceae bacterium]
IWWWMAAGFALLVAAISLLPFEKKSAQQIASQEITHENNENINIAEKGTLPEENLKTITEDNSKKEAEISENQTVLPVASLSVDFSKKEAISVLEKSSQNGTKNLSQPIALSEDEQDGNNQLVTETVWEAATIPNKGNLLLSDRLAYLPIQAIQTKESFLYSESFLIEVAKNKTRKVGFDIQAGMLTEDFSAFNGLEGSFLVSLPLNRRWKLNTGLGISYLKNPKVIVYSTDTLQYDADPSYDPNTEAVRAVTKNRESFVEQKSFLLLDLPILAEYTLLPKWSVYGGVKNSFLLPENSTLEFSQVELTNSSDTFDSNQIFTTSYTYPTYTLSGLLGSKYYFGKSTFVWAQYQHAFPFKKDPVGYRNNRFAIGAGFSF